MEQQTGRVFRAEVRDRNSWSVARLVVTFAEHPQLEMLLPERMHEVFSIGGGIGEGHARYSNFRRFTTSARIIPPE
jgi:hypothetical protein